MLEIWNNFILAWKKALDFKGTANRKEFWHFVLIYMLIYIIFYYLDESLGTYQIIMVQQDDFQFLLRLGYFELAYTFFAILPTFSLSVRRLHDIGKSAWWLFLQFILPPVGQIAFLILMAMPTKLNNNPYLNTQNNSNQVSF